MSCQNRELPNNATIEYTSILTNFEYLGSGSSCIAYSATKKPFYKDPDDAKCGIGEMKVIVKEYFPSGLIDSEKLRRDDHYQIIESSGQGSNGSLWKAGKEDFRQRVCAYQNEYCQNAGSDWPLVKIQDVIEKNNTIYIVSEQMSGDLVKKFTMEQKPFLLILALMKALYSSLILIEEEGLIMTDLKDSNVWFETKDGSRGGCEKAWFFDIDGFVNLKKHPDPCVNVKANGPAYPLTRMYTPYKAWNNASYRITEFWHINNAGLMLYECIFGKLLAKLKLDEIEGTLQEIQELIKNKKTFENELISALSYLSREVISKLADFFEYSLIEKEDERYSSKKALEMIGKIEKLYLRECSQLSENEKKYYDLCKAFTIIDSHPIFKYHGSHPSVMIIGDHKDDNGNIDNRIREAFFKVVFACAQIFDYEKNDYVVPDIHLVNYDADVFVNGMCQSLPEFKNGINLWIDGKQSSECIVDSKLTRLPFVNVYIHTLQNYELEEVISQVGYFFVLDPAWNNLIINKALENSFICAFSSENNIADEMKVKNRHVKYMYDVPYLTASERNDFDKLEKKGFQIHRYYSRNLYSREKNSKLNNDYKDFDLKEYPHGHRFYDYFSSIRSAVTILYKIYSVLDGLGMADADVTSIAPKELDEILNHADESDEYVLRLMALEHRSWSAWNVINGWMRIETFLNRNGHCYYDDVKEWIIEQFTAEKEEEESKKVSVDEPRITYKKKFHNGKDVHSALYNCEASQPLKDDANWKKPENDNSFDELDRASIRNRQIMKDLINLNHKLEVSYEAWNTDFVMVIKKLEAYKSKNKEFDAIIGVMNNARQSILAGDDSALTLWKEQYNLLCGLVETSGDKKKLDDLYRFHLRLIPAAEYFMMHDFKDSDIAIIKALPVIMADMDIICLHRPITGKCIEDILGILLLEPDYVVFEGISDEKVKENYINIIKQLGRDDVVPIEESGTNIEGKHILDMTGISGIDQDRFRSKFGNDCLIIDTQDGKIRSSNDEKIGLFYYDMRLTVDDAVKMVGIELHDQDADQRAVMNASRPYGLIEELGKQGLWPQIKKDIENSKCVTRQGTITSTQHYDVKSDKFVALESIVRIACDKQSKYRFNIEFENPLFGNPIQKINMNEAFYDDYIINGDVSYKSRLFIDMYHFFDNVRMNARLKNDSQHIGIDFIATKDFNVYLIMVFRDRKPSPTRIKYLLEVKQMFGEMAEAVIITSEDICEEMDAYGKTITSSIYEYSGIKIIKSDENAFDELKKFVTRKPSMKN